MRNIHTDLARNLETNVPWPFSLRGSCQNLLQETGQKRMEWRMERRYRASQKSGNLVQILMLVSHMGDFDQLHLRRLLKTVRLEPCRLIDTLFALFFEVVMD